MDCAASGASSYRVERKGAGGSYSLLATTASNSTTDSGASTGSAYLYRVCAADGSGNCTSDYSNIALGMSVSFTDATIVSYSDNPSTATSIKAAHITELRTAINAVRSLAGQSAATWTNTTLTAQSSVISADDVRDLRTALHAALTTLNIQTSSYTDNTIVSFTDDPMNATAVKAVHIRELRTRTTTGAGNSTSGGSSGGLKYVLSDLQGTTRAVMNNNGSSSAIVARHDYLPFGEELSSVVGLRSSSQGYSATDTNRQKYGMTERDATSGLDHTWWRKYESTSGRWTSPDPLSGSIADPQSFNHYSYTGNDPVNFVDPSGLDPLPSIGTFRVNALPPSADPLSATGAFTASFLRGEIMVETGENGGVGLETQNTSLPCPPRLGEAPHRATLALAHYREGSGKPLILPIGRIDAPFPVPTAFPAISALISQGTGSRPFVTHLINNAQSLPVQASGQQATYLGRITFNLHGILNVYMTGHYQFSGSIGVNDDPFDFHPSSGPHQRSARFEVSAAIGGLFSGKVFDFIIDGRRQVEFEGNSKGVTVSECK